MWLLEGVEKLQGDEIGFELEIEWLCEALGEGALFKSARIRPLDHTYTYEDGKSRRTDRPLADWRAIDADGLRLLLGPTAIKRIEQEAWEKFEYDGGWEAVRESRREDQLSQREAV